MSTNEEPIRLDICKVCDRTTDAGHAYHGRWICDECAETIAAHWRDLTTPADQAALEDALERARPEQPPSWVGASATAYEEWAARERSTP